MPETDYRWQRHTSRAAFAPRDGAGALVHAGKLWLLGGWNPEDTLHFPRLCNSEVWSSEDGQRWTLELPAAPWEPRHTAGYAVHDGRLWVVGGDANQGHYQNDVWASVDGRQWDCVSDSVPWAPRVLHVTGVFQDRLWVIGGQTLPQFAPAEERRYADVWCSRDGRRWDRVLDDAPWAPLGMIGGAVAFHDRLWLLGGGTYQTPAHPGRIVRNTVWSSGDGRDWQRHPDAPWPARQYHAAAVFDDRLWVLGGCSPATGDLGDAWWSADGDTWTAAPPCPGPARHAASVYPANAQLIVAAGSHLCSDVWRLSAD
jgi:hypothetical protein